MHSSFQLSRRDVIEERLLGGKSVIAADLAHEFAVSEDAIRTLAAECKCRRVYGGALPKSATKSLRSRITESSDTKAELGKAAATLIRADEFVFIDAGNTNLTIVGYIGEDLNLTVGTNSIDIAVALLVREDIRLVLVRGVVNSTVGGSVDAVALEQLADLNIDRCFVGACSVSPELGIGAQLPDDAAFKRRLMERSRVRIVMATADKLQERSAFRIGSAADIDTLIVGGDLAETAIDELSSAGFSVKVADELR